MPYHYPIYAYVSRDRGQSNKAQFGAREGFDADIRVGTSRKNSHNLANVAVERYELDDGTVRFTMSIDGERFRSGVLRGKEFTIDGEAA